MAIHKIYALRDEHRRGTCIYLFHIISTGGKLVALCSFNADNTFYWLNYYLAV